MAKKKKKKKSKQNKQNSLFKKIRYEQFVPEKILMTPFLIYDDDEHNKNEIAYSRMKKEYDVLSIKEPNMKYLAEKAINNTEWGISHAMDEATNMYLTMHECDDNLNLMNPKTLINTSADILDFTKFEETDILKAVMFRLVNKEIHPDDISLLWSTNEYIHVIISPSLEYAIKRLGYDEINKTVSYEIVCLEKRIYFTTEIIHIPSVICRVTISLENASDMNLPEPSSDEAYTEKHNKTALQWSVMYNLENMIKGEPDEYIYPVYTINEATNIIHYERFFKKCEHNAMKENNERNQRIRNVAEKAVKTICTGISLGKNTFSTETCAHYTYQKISVGIAAIILTNIMLQSEKLSSPETKKSHKAASYEVASESSNDKQNKPVRKTRNLGLIRITSERRPSVPTMNKIIRFSKAEWSRQGFMRHYKSGKTVFIRPTTVKRRCVDVSQTKSQQQSTKYVVHSDKIKK